MKMKGTFIFLACVCLAVGIHGAAVQSPVPIALLGTDDGVKDVIEEAAGAVQDVAAEAVEQVSDVIQEGPGAIIENMKETLEAAVPSLPAVDDVFDDVPGAATDEIMDDGAPAVAAAADDVIDDVIPESADERKDDVMDDLPQTDDDVTVPEVEVTDDVNDDTVREERTDDFRETNDLDLSPEVSESSQESLESDEATIDPMAAFMGMVREFKDDVMDDVIDDRGDSASNDVSDDKKDEDYGSVMRRLGGKLQSIGIQEDPETFVEKHMDDRDDVQEDEYEHLLDMSNESSDSSDSSDDYDHLLDDVVDDLFGDDNDGLLDIQPKHAAPKPRHGYYGYAPNMVNTVQANMAYDRAHDTGTCPLYPVNIDEDKVTITTQGGCTIVIKLKGATVESVQTDGDNLTERERVARSVEVSYSSEKRED